MIGKVRSNIHDCNADFGAGTGFSEFFPGKAIQVVSEGDFFDHILAVKGRSVQYVHPKGNGYEIVEYYLLEYDCLDSDTVIGFGRLIDIAKLEEKDRVLELIKASYKKANI